MSRAKTTTNRSVWTVRCPSCDTEVDIEQTDAGQYDGIEIQIEDCPSCARSIFTDTVTVVVAAHTQDDASLRAARIRGNAR